MPLLLYLHGLNSSPYSYKSEATRQWLFDKQSAIDFLCPQLDNSPAVAMQQIEKIIADYQGDIYLAGSSMGGYYATYFADKYGLRATIINPSVRPVPRIESMLGENTNWHTGDIWVMKPHHVDEYAAFEINLLQKPENVLVLLQTGDEVLDYREAVDFYVGSEVVVEQGGDHGFQNYERYLPKIIEFLTQ